MNFLLALGLVAAMSSANNPLAEAEAELSHAINVDELKAHVYRLSSKEFLGRRGSGAQRTARHLAEAFQRLKLEPAFGDSYFQQVTFSLSLDRTDIYLGRNVGAILPGSDPKLRHEWILLNAHYDHLGVKGAAHYPGADDNASGVAMLLEVAERFALAKEKPRRTIFFVAFDMEEAGLIGARHFANHPPRPLAQLKCCLTADMLGRSMANLMDEYVFCIGAECSPHLRQLVKAVRPEPGLKIGRLGGDLIGTRSDYGPFRDREIPFLFFTTGVHDDYHQVTDLPDRIDYYRLQKICHWIHTLTERLANDEATPAWDREPPTELEEVRTVLTLLTRVLKSPDRYPLKTSQRNMVSGVERRLTEIVARGTYTSSERTWLLWMSRLMMVTVF